MASENQDKAVLHYPGGEYEMDIMHATEGNDGVVLGKFLGETGLVTFDPGYVSTGSTESKITYIDGDAGILRYRGYDIADLANNATFNEVSYLLINGELPTTDELENFNSELRHHTLLDEDFKAAFNIFPRNAHPMAVLASSVNILSAYYQDQLNPLDEEQLDKATVRLMAKVPMLAAYAYRASRGKPYMYPDNSLNPRENFMRMMFGYPTEDYEIDPILTDALDKLLILHADHEQNCSTSTVRLVGSTGASPYAAVAAGIAALWGPAHGGANEAVVKMLEEIGSPERIPEFIAKAKDKDSHHRLMGFGHRVYKNYDPRAGVLKESADEVLDLLGQKNNPKLAIAKELERIALNDDYFAQRKLFPNVDFYSGIILEAMGIPTKMFTAIFALARTVGWMAQWNEMIADPEQKIGRPRQLYTGPTQRSYVPLAER